MNEKPPIFNLYFNIKNNIRAVQQFVKHRLVTKRNPTDQTILEVYEYHNKNETIDKCIAALCILVEDEHPPVIHGVDNVVLFLEAERLLYELGIIPNEELYQIPDERANSIFIFRDGFYVPMETGIRSEIGDALMFKYQNTLTGSAIQGNIGVSAETMNFMMDIVWSIMACVKDGNMKYANFIKKTGMSSYVNLSSR